MGSTMINGNAEFKGLVLGESAPKPLLTLPVIGLVGMVLVIRDVEWGPFYTVVKLNGIRVMIKFGVKFWDDEAINLIIGDWELPLREFPKWLKTTMYRFEGLWFRGYGDGYVLYFLYLDEGTIMILLGLAPREVREFTRRTIDCVKRRALPVVEKPT